MRRPSGPPAEVTVGSGACLLVPARRFREVGGFWEAMFLYCEDTDLCWRLRLAGLRILVCPEARVRHDYDFGRNASKLYHLERNRLLMLAANYELSTLARLAPALVGHRARAARRRRARAAGCRRSCRHSPPRHGRCRRCASSAVRSHCCGAFPTAASRAGSSAGSGRSSARASRASAHRCSRPTPASSGSRRARQRRRQGGCARTTRPARRGGQPGDRVCERVRGRKLCRERATRLGLRATGRGVAEQRAQGAAPRPPESPAGTAVAAPASTARAPSESPCVQTNGTPALSRSSSRVRWASRCSMPSCARQSAQEASARMAGSDCGAAHGRLSTRSPTPRVVASASTSSSVSGASLRG